MKRGFSDLPVLLDQWKPMLGSQADATRLLVRVVAQRGASPKDLQAMRRRGVQFITLEESQEAKSKLDGRTLVVRGRFAHDEVSGPASGWTIHERDETSSSSGAFDRTVTVRAGGRTYVGTYQDESTTFSSKETGRIVQVRGKPGQRTNKERDYLFLCRIVEATRPDADSPPDLTVVVEEAAEVTSGFY
ncbi:MAG: hypothetical protein QM765_24800 [Myxococcales bacterium]